MTDRRHIEKYISAYNSYHLRIMLYGDAKSDHNQIKSNQMHLIQTTKIHKIKILK